MPLIDRKNVEYWMLNEGVLYLTSKIYNSTLSFVLSPLTHLCHLGQPVSCPGSQWLFGDGEPNSLIYRNECLMLIHVILSPEYTAVRIPLVLWQLQ